MTSRSQVATFIAGKLAGDRHEAIVMAAAWLVDQKRSGEVHYLANDVARALEHHGYTYAQVTTAEQISGEAKDHVRKFVAAQSHSRDVELQNSVDETVIGGVRIETPDRELDATVAFKLAKFVEGVSQ